jgi:hypothetical protein
MDDILESVNRLAVPGYKDFTLSEPWPFGGKAVADVPDRMKGYSVVTLILIGLSAY